MKLTERDKEMFKALGSVASGNQLVDYLQRLKAYHGNISNMEHDDVQARRDALKIIEDDIIKLIKLS